MPLDPVHARPLTPSQEGMLFHALLRPEEPLYVEQRWCTLRGALNVDAFRAAWDGVWRAHGMLRSAFHWQDGQSPVQWVDDEALLDWREPGTGQVHDAATLQAWLSIDRAQGFALDRAPLMRCTLWRINADEHFFVWTYHHLLMDGWSNGLLLREVLQRYEQACRLWPEVQGAERPVSETGIGFHRYLDWLAKQDAAVARAYWHQALAPVHEPTPLPELRSIRPPGQGGTSPASSPDWARTTSSLSTAQTQALQEAARRWRVTLNTVVQGAWALLLARLSGQAAGRGAMPVQVCFGAVSSGRPAALPQSGHMIGMFIQTLPVRVEVDEAQDVETWLRAQQDEQAHREVHGHLGLAQIQRQSGLPAGTPLFDHILVYENYPLSSQAALGQTSDAAPPGNGAAAALAGGLRLQELGGHEQTHYPVALMVLPGTSLGFELRHDRHRLSDVVARRWLDRLCQTLLSLSDPLMQSLGDVKVLPPQELAWLQDAEALRPSPEGQLGIDEPGQPLVPVHVVLARQAARQGAQIAVFDRDPDAFEAPERERAAEQLTRAWSWQQLEDKVAAWAGHLQASGVRPGDRVGVSLPRSAELLACWLAVHRVGGAYVPLDASHPAERLSMVLADAGLSHLVSTSRPGGLLSDGLGLQWPEGLRRIDLSLESCQQASPLTALSAPRQVHDDAAYVLFTSGSTGRPKGVVVGHGALDTFLRAMSQAPGLRPRHRLLATTTVAFDIAGLELFLPLLCGATLYIAPEGLARDPERLSACILNHGIDTLQATPTTWRLLLDTTGLPPGQSLRALVGGEALPADLARWLLNHAAEVWNLYGPTETTIWSSVLRLEGAHLPESAGDSGIPVGRPIPGTRFAVRDAALRPVPIGVPGELFIGGLGLAQGYLGRPDLTAAAYLPDPEVPGGRLYRTGDLVSWRDDGLLRFLGRLDQQMKWRGHRMEAGEIESALLAQAGVAQAAVVLRVAGQGSAQGEPELVAYLVANGGAQAPRPTAASLMGVLKQRLPGYMVPTRLVWLRALPQTPNGKVDRRTLALQPMPPDPGVEGHLDADGPVAPSAHLNDDPIAGLVSSNWAQVLGLPSVPADARFFDLGGHSLHVTQVMARLRRALGLSLPLQMLFEYPALPDFIRAVRAQRGAVASQASGSSDGPAQRLPEAERQGLVLPLLPSQQRQCLMALRDPASAAYTIPLVLRLRGPLDIALLLSTWALLVQRHDALRMSFKPGADTALPHQARLHDPQAVLQVAGCLPDDPQGWASSVDDEARAGDQVRSWVAEPFDLQQAPLWRLRLLRLASDHHWLVLTVHHILLDDASLGILARDWHGLYSAAVQGGQPWDAARQAWRTPRADLAEAMLQASTSDAAAWLPAQEHWQSVLARPVQPLALRQVRSVPSTHQGAHPALNPSPSRHAHRIMQPVPAATVAHLRKLAGQQGLTLYMALLAGFGALLRRHANSDDLLLATPVAGRTRPALEGLVGLFVNTVPVRLDAAGGQDIGHWLDHVRGVTLGAFEHQALPFEDILAQMPHAVDGAPCPVLFSLQNAHGRLPEAEAGGLQWSPWSTGTGEAKADLSLMLQPTPDGQGLIACWEARPSCLDLDALQRMAGHYDTVLYALGRDLSCPLSALPMLTRDEEEALRQWSKGPEPVTSVLEGPSGSLASAFVRQARRTPKAVALREGDCSWTYEALLQQAASWAVDLQAHALWPQADADAPQPVVALWGERSAATLIGLLASLLAGACHVPLDPAVPASRQADIVRRCQARWLLVPSARAMHQARAAHFDSPLAIIDLSARHGSSGAVALDGWLDQRLAAEDQTARGDRLACIMHTSGSTGEPKGVCVTHRAILRLVQPQPALRYGPDEVWLQAAPLAFDASTFEIWGAWLHGARLVVAPPELELDALGTLIRHEEVSSLWLTAGLFKLVVDERLDDLASVRQLVAGGDVLSVPHVRRVMGRWPGLRVVNGYGPTETTTFACCHLIAPDDVLDGTDQPIPIGRPIARTAVRVLDAHGQPQPIGLPGELHIGGAGLARGYLDQPVATALAFVPDPWPDLDDFDEGAHTWTLYRTGDLVAWREDGSLDFLGRCDRQVKIRGFRIEPAEVEAALSRHPAVRRVAVVPRTDPGGHVHLVVYPVWKVHATVTPSIAELRRWLSAHLPPHLLPSASLAVAELPLNANGKLDLHALPMPDWTDAGTASPAQDAHEVNSAELPQTAQALLALWHDLLPGRRIGPHDNFFDLGGDSILAMQLVSRARARGLTLTPAQVMQHQTVAALADVCGSAQVDEDDADWLRRHPHDPQRLPLTPVQQWWLRAQGFDAQTPPTHHNQAVCLSLPPGVDRRWLQQALHAVVSRHDAFRWRLRIDAAAGWHAGLAPADAPDTLVPIVWHDLAAQDADEQARRIEVQADEAHGAVDLVNGPVWCAVGWDLGPAHGQRLLLTVHHAVIDAVSWRVLLDELQLAWRHQGADLAAVLGPRPRGLARWALSLQARKASAQAVLATAGIDPDADQPNQAGLEPCRLPIDGPASREEASAVAQAQVLERRVVLAEVGLPGELRLPDHIGMQDTLLMALARTFAHTMPLADTVALTLEAHGRQLPGPALHDDSDTWHGVGWYTALCPVQVPLALARAGLPLTELASCWKEALSHGQAWGLSQSAAPLGSDISFNHLGQLPADDLGDGWRRLPTPGQTRHLTQRRAHLVEIDTCLSEGQWLLRWTFGERHHQAATIAGWMDDWIAQWIGVLHELQRDADQQQSSGQDFGLDEADMALALAQVRFSETS